MEKGTSLTCHIVSALVGSAGVYKVVMATTAHRSSYSGRLILGMDLRAVRPPLSIIIGSVPPTIRTVIIPGVILLLPVILEISGSQLCQLNKGGGGGRCVCGLESSSVLESKHSEVMDGNDYSSFKVTTQPTSLLALHITLPSPRIKHPILVHATTSRAELATDRENRLKVVK